MSDKKSDNTTGRTVRLVVSGYAGKNDATSALDKIHEVERQGHLWMARDTIGEDNCMVVLLMNQRTWHSIAASYGTIVNHCPAGPNEDTLGPRRYFRGIMVMECPDLQDGDIRVSLVLTRSQAPVLTKPICGLAEADGGPRKFDKTLHPFGGGKA